MTLEKLKEVISYYKFQLAKRVVCCQLTEEEYESYEVSETRYLEHAHWMCEHILNVLVVDNEVEKCMRWLGFIQGVLGVVRWFSISELRDHSRTY